jgi:hypothetical protein
MEVEKHVNIKRKRKVQNTTCHHIDLIKLDDVDIFVYEFNLIKRGNLRSKTIGIIERLFPQEINER